MNLSCSASIRIYDTGGTKYFQGRNQASDAVAGAYNVADILLNGDAPYVIDSDHEFDVQIYVGAASTWTVSYLYQEVDL